MKLNPMTNNKNNRKMIQADYAAWSLYTGPSNLKNIIDHPDCSWIVGQWDGVNANTSIEEVKKDIDYRIDVILNAFKKMLPRFKTNDRHFVIPEFFFRCKQGPYPYIKVDEDQHGSDIYPFEYIVLRLKEELKDCIENEDGNDDYTIIIGSALTSNVVNYEAFLKSHSVQGRLDELNEIINYHKIYDNFLDHSNILWNRRLIHNVVENVALNELNEFMRRSRGNPLCTVRNRGAYFHFNKEIKDRVEIFIYEKQSESSIDLTMGMFDVDKKIITANGMITEWLANYPSHSIVHGDKQTTPSSTNARFSPSPYYQKDVGVEICLDHSLQRLRRSINMQKKYGADTDNFPLIKQFIPSGGMQILDHSVAVEPNSIIFNVDGIDKVYLYDDRPGAILEGDSGSFKGIAWGVYNQSIQSKWTGRDKNTYYSHSQIAFAIEKSAIEDFNNALGKKNPAALTYEGSSESPHNEITDSFCNETVSFKLNEDMSIFTLNDGELHHYYPK